MKVDQVPKVAEFRESPIESEMCVVCVVRGVGVLFLLICEVSSGPFRVVCVRHSRKCGRFAPQEDKFGFAVQLILLTVYRRFTH